MLAMDYCKDIKGENKPTILLHNTLPSLLKDPDFRNKANRGRTIFMEDEGEFLELKIRSAFCPPKVAGNPCLAYIEYVIFPWFGKFEVAQKEENGRNNLSMTTSMAMMKLELLLTPLSNAGSDEDELNQRAGHFGISSRLSFMAVVIIKFIIIIICLYYSK
uniref:Uncharacterized protein n=1 Tax=Oryza glumipatula TaxID=40148 RepID=A0A0E0A6Q4_9ORYZ